MIQRFSTIAAVAIGAGAVVAAYETGVTGGLGGAPTALTATTTGPDGDPVAEIRADRDRAEAERDAAMARLREAIQQHADAATQTRLRLEAHETRIAELSAVVDSGRIEAEARDARIGTLDAALEAREARIAVLEATLVERDAELARVGGTLDRRGTELAALAEERSAHDAEIAALEADLADRDARIAGLTEDLADRESDIAGLERVVAAKETGAGPLPRDGDVRQTLASLAGSDAEVLAPADGGAAAPPPLQSRPIPGLFAEIHFESGSASLTPGARAKARAAAEALAQMDLEAVDLRGFTDSVGSAEANRALGEARAQSVADIFVEAGLSRDILLVKGIGEAGGPVRTPDGVAEPLNRCVGIFPVLAGTEQG